MSSIALNAVHRFSINNASILRSLTPSLLRSISSFSSSSSSSSSSSISSSSSFSSSSLSSSFSSRSFLSCRFFSSDSSSTPNPSSSSSPTNTDSSSTTSTETPKDPAVLASEYEKLKIEYEKLKIESAKQSESLDQVRRAAADLDNQRKRAMEEAKKERLFAIQSFAKQLLDVADTLEIAIKEAHKQKDNESDNFKSMVVGIEMTMTNLQKAFDKGGVKKMNPLGEVFDPHKHEVIVSIPSPDKTPNTVIEVFKSGYLLNDRCLRAAQVATSKKA